jgi:hypothetical protein
VKKGLLILAFWSSSAFTSVDDYLYRYKNPSHSSWGTSGLIQMPNARFHEAGSVGVTYNNFDPYVRLGLIAYPFSNIEAIYQYTDIKNKLYSNNFAFSGNQTYKDKGFDFKFKVINESKYFPAVAVGLKDAAGTGLFSAEFITASKRYKNIDFTAGVGWGAYSSNSFRNPLINISERFKTRDGFSSDSSKGGEFEIDNYFSGPDAGIFAGAEVYIPYIQGLRLKFEMDSTNYYLEGFDVLEAKSKYNFGLSYAISNQLSLNLGYVRGNTLQFGFSMVGSFGKKNPLIPKNDSLKKISDTEILRKVNENERYLYLTILKNLRDNGIMLRGMETDGEILRVTYAQSKYQSYVMAQSRVSDVLNQIAPNKYKTFVLTSMNTKFLLSSVEVPRDSFISNKKTKDFISISHDVYYSKPPKVLGAPEEYQPKIKYPAVFFSLSPSFQTHIGGPERFLVGGLHIRADSEILFARNLSLQTILRYPVVQSFDILREGSNSIIPHVRTDLIEYLKEADGIHIVRSQFNIFNQPFNSIYTKFSAGIFEEMFAGFGGEILYRDYNRPWAIGLDIHRVKQRAYRQLFGLREYKTTTGHATLYVHEPKSKVLLKLIGGRFLAGDSGISVDVSRRFKSGLRVGAYFTLTDISSEEFGEGSFDKGFYLNFPVEAFFTNYSRGLTGFGLRPLTRDGGAKLIVGHDLYGITDEGSLFYTVRDNDDWYE